MRARESGTSPKAGATGPDSSVQEGSGSRVQSVDRAARLLRAVAEAGSTGAATSVLGEACALNRATAWRLLSTLELNGLVASDRATGRWRLGAELVDLARRAGSEVVLLRDVHEVLEELAGQTGETAALAVLRHGALSYVQEVASTAMVAASVTGRPVSLHATSTGKVALVWVSEAEREALLSRTLERFTETTITDRDELLAELEHIRARGYATCRGEYDASAWGVSAPVLDGAGGLLAVVSVWGPPQRVHHERFAALGTSVRAAAARMAPW